MSVGSRVLLALALGLSAIACAPRPEAHATELPGRLSDREFWKLVTNSSEPNGYFRSDNLTSNELWFQHVIPDLVNRTRPGGVYLGVGPEQNFTYMAALRPSMAIIFDIRRGNLLAQLMYKALFELAADRADFVSMLFSKPRPPGLGAGSTADDLFSAFDDSPADTALSERNLQAIESRLTGTHALPLSPSDLEGIEYVYRAFRSRGFAVRDSPTYVDLMTETDDEGVTRSYLAAEAGFAFLKELESNNLVVPIVGDFAGPKAIRAVAAYLKAHDATVTAFYLSNVEQYLYPRRPGASLFELGQKEKWTDFCRNVATLPLDASSTFIRSSSGRGRGFGVGFVSSLGNMMAEVKKCR
jgi:hypothetical protein